MKELSIEEKAKRYDEAIEKFDVILNLDIVKESGTIFAEDVRKILPELKESEDERIRKELIMMVKLSCTDGDDVDKKIAWLEKQGEQKPVDLVAIMKDYFANTPKEQQEKDWAELKHLNDVGFDIEIPFGAKDSELQEVSYYIPEGFHAEIEGNKVVIKRDEQKPAWSEEDEKMRNATIKFTLENGFIQTNLGHILITKGQMVDWLKSLKDRVQPKQEWSEEDEEYINDLIGVFDGQQHQAHSDEEIVKWLKSLRPQNRWKPSDEQIRELSIVSTGKGWFSKEILSELLEQLKKLREE